MSGSLTHVLFEGATGYALFTVSLQEEIAGKRKAGCSVRDVSFTRVRGANHLVGALWTELTEFCRMFTFLQVHWEEPERVLKAFLA